MKVYSVKKYLWFDFENAPHVWIFKELLSAFPENEVIVTVRNFSSTVGICDYLKIPYEIVGKQSKSKSNIGKFGSVVNRAFSLRRYFYKKKIKPSLSISHGSRSQAIASFMMGVPQIFLEDYEHSFNGLHRLVNFILTPFPIKKEAWGKNINKVVHYPGLKEELYLWNEKNLIQNNLEIIRDNKLNIIFRPEGYNTHYSSKKSQYLQEEFINLFAKNNNIHIILISRDKIQEKIIIETFKKLNISYSIPKGIINGPALISKCDAVVGGGGTMTREACVLNIPSYSFFGGTKGDVDKYLESKNLLNYINEIDDIRNINFEKRKNSNIESIRDEAFVFVKNFIENKLKDK